MKNIYNKKKNINNNINKKNNIIFISVIIFIVIALIIISFINPKKEEEIEFYAYDVSKFKFLTVIGIEELKSSIQFDGKSLITICSSEEKKCYDMLNEMNDAKLDTGIEFIDTVTLVDFEREYLNELLKGKKEYPYIIRIENNKVSIVSDNYINKDQYKEIVKETFK